MVGGKNIFAGRANMKSPARTNTKFMLDKYKVRTHKSVTVTGTNLISKSLASCCHGEGVDCAAMLLVSTAAEEKLLIPVRMGMVPVRIMKRRMIQVRM